MSPQTTAPVEPVRADGKVGGMHEDELLETLARAVAREAAAVSDLREALVRQRDGVARDAIDSVHASCDDIARLLVTLDASRTHRVRLLSTLVPDGPATLEGLAESRGGLLPPALAEAGLALRRAAEGAAREASVNRVVLQRTVEAGESFLQALFAGGPDPVYRPGDRRDDDGSGKLLDRKV